MKKITFYILISLLGILGIQAQTLTTYQFQEKTGSYLWRPARTLGFASNADDDEQTLAIPFNFEYAGQVYNSLIIGVNGAVTLTGTDVFAGNDLSATVSGRINIIAPFWDDLVMDPAENSSISYRFSGTAPNRSVVIHWNNMRRYGSAYTGKISFSLLLRETTNAIKFFYGSNTLNDSNASIGFNASDGTTTTFVSLTLGSHATVSTTTANNDINASSSNFPSSSSSPSSGTYYIFSPRPPNDYYGNSTEPVLTVLDADADAHDAANQIYAYNAGATNSGGVAPTHGDWDTHTRDIWYRFTAPASGTVSITRPYRDQWSSLSYAVYAYGHQSGAEIVSNAIYSSDIDKRIYISGLTPGSIYHIRMWDFGNDDFGLMRFCLREGQVNEEAINAISIPVYNYNDVTATYTTANNTGANNSESINGAPSCSIFSGGDVWYKFIAPAEGVVRVIHSDTPGAWSSFVNAVYDSHTANTSVDCGIIYISGSNPPFEETVYTGLTPGNVYYLRAWDYRNNDFGESSFLLRRLDPAGIEDVNNLDFSFYPNPVSDVINITAQEDINIIKLYNISGQLVKVIEPDTQKISINIADLPQGVYLMRVQNESSVKTVKVIKK